MLVPSIFGENLFDDFMDFPFDDDFWGRKNPLYGKNAKRMMKTEVLLSELGNLSFYLSSFVLVVI